MFAVLEQNQHVLYEVQHMFLISFKTAVFDFLRLCYVGWNKCCFYSENTDSYVPRSSVYKT
jgi:hypothetical protein